jgi:hypothetical protein
MNKPKIKIDDSVMSEVLMYLAKQPYEQVAGLIDKIGRSMEPIHEKETKNTE